MRLLLTGDWHIRNTTPQNRVDDYWATVQDKIRFILHLAEEEECDLILQPGDFYDSHKANDFLKYTMIKRLNNAGIKVITVFGQHDLRYHSSDIRNTPLAVLVAAKVAYTAPNWDPMHFDNSIYIYGASWHEDIPTNIVDKNGFNILVMHKMVIANEKLWDGQEKYELGNILLRTHPFDLIVAGDNHQHFVLTRKARHLVNCGSLLRSNIDQVDHTPVVYIYDTRTEVMERYWVPCKPFEQVFNLEKVEKEKERNKKMEVFVERLTGKAELEGLDFVKNMDTFVRTNKDEIDDDTLEIIEEVMS
ncbi:MAG: hypothetical protein AM326_01770 [Candidatus Thorarchaeota archaeon SMTZ-45]|nr:MAG: hypothetical protein AM326_01770 [Candidatus Thorarchaeota archaeon SMTZ-45]